MATTRWMSKFRFGAQPHVLYLLTTMPMIPRHIQTCKLSVSLLWVLMGSYCHSISGSGASGKNHWGAYSTSKRWSVDGIEDNHPPTLYEVFIKATITRCWWETRFASSMQSDPKFWRDNLSPCTKFPQNPIFLLPNSTQTCALWEHHDTHYSNAQYQRAQNKQSVPTCVFVHASGWSHLGGCIGRYFLPLHFW